MEDIVITAKQIEKGPTYGDFQYYKPTDGEGYWKKGSVKIPKGNRIKGRDGAYYQFNSDGSVTTLYSNGKFTKFGSKLSADEKAHIKAGHVWDYTNPDWEPGVVRGWRNDSSLKKRYDYSDSTGNYFMSNGRRVYYSKKHEFTDKDRLTISQASKPLNWYWLAKSNTTKMDKVKDKVNEKLGTKDYRQVSDKKISQAVSEVAKEENLSVKETDNLMNISIGGKYMQDPIHTLDKEIGIVTAAVPNAISGNAYQGISPLMFSEDWKNTNHNQGIVGQLTDYSGKLFNRVLNTATTVAAPLLITSGGTSIANTIIEQGIKEAGKLGVKKGVNLLWNVAKFSAIEEAIDHFGGEAFDEIFGPEWSANVKMAVAGGLSSAISNPAKSAISLVLLKLATMPTEKGLQMYRFIKAKAIQLSKSAAESGFLESSWTVLSLARALAKNVKLQAMENRLKAYKELEGLILLDEKMMAEEVNRATRLLTLLEKQATSKLTKTEEKKLELLLKKYSQTVRYDDKKKEWVKSASKKAVSMSDARKEAYDKVVDMTGLFQWRGWRTFGRQLLLRLSLLPESGVTGIIHTAANAKNIFAPMIMGGLPILGLTKLVDDTEAGLALYSNLITAPMFDLTVGVTGQRLGTLGNMRQSWALSENSGGKASSAKVGPIKYLFTEAGKLHKEVGVGTSAPSDKSRGILDWTAGPTRVIFGMTGKGWSGLYNSPVNMSESSVGNYFSNGNHIYLGPSHQSYLSVPETEFVKKVNSRIWGNEDRTMWDLLGSKLGYDHRIYKGLRVNTYSNIDKNTLRTLRILTKDGLEPLFIGGILNPKVKVTSSTSNIALGRTGGYTKTGKDIFVMLDIRGHGEIEVILPNGKKGAITIDDWGPGSGSGGGLLATIASNWVWNPATNFLSIILQGELSYMKNGTKSKHYNPIE